MTRGTAGAPRDDFVQGGHLVDRAAPHEAGVVLALRDEAARWLTQRGIEQWHPGEVPIGLIEARVAKGEVFVLRSKGHVAGTVSVTWRHETTWGRRSDDAGYVHMLVVEAALRGTGVGARLLRWAEGYIAATGRKWSRLDCVRTNRGLRRWYERAGYAHVGGNEFPDGPPWALAVALYEKRVKP